MMKFKNFLSEAPIIPYRVQRLDDHDVINTDKMMKIINEKYSDAWNEFYNSDNGIFRGHNIGNSLAAIAEPKTGVRKSQNTANYYTILLDNNPHLKDFPKRSESFICHTDPSRASEYENEGGGRETCLVLPKNGAKIAIANRYDIWDVRVPFISHNEVLGDLASILYDIVEFDLKENTLEEFKKSISLNIDEIFKQLCSNTHIAKIKNMPGEKDVDKLINFIFQKWDLKTLKFELITTKEMNRLENKNSEVWLDDECLLITWDIAYRLVNRLKERENEKI